MSNYFNTCESQEIISSTIVVMVLITFHQLLTESSQSLNMVVKMKATHDRMFLPRTMWCSSEVEPISSSLSITACHLLSLGGLILE